MYPPVPPETHEKILIYLVGFGVILNRSDSASLSEKFLKTNSKSDGAGLVISMFSASFCPLTMLRSIVRQKVVMNFSARQRWRAQRREL
jgi:hypothetical protein